MSDGGPVTEDRGQPPTGWKSRGIKSDYEMMGKNFILEYGAGSPMDPVDLGC